MKEKKYEFIKNGVDDYTLKYKDKEINFNSNVDIASRLQEANKIGRNQMIINLAKNGTTVKELTKEIKKDGKTYYDNSNIEALEKNYIQEAQNRIFIEVVEELFKVKFTEFILDIGIETEEDMKKFGEDFANIITGNFPSK